MKSLGAMPVANATVRDIPALENLRVFAINDSDEVVGDSAQVKPFKWTPSGGLVYLTIPALSGKFASAMSVNDNGVIAGFVAAGDSGYYHAAAWLPDGSLRVFQLPAQDSAAGYSCSVSSINIYGQMVGNCAVSDAVSDPTIFEWHAPAMINPPTVPGNTLTSISDDGWMGGGGAFVTGTGNGLGVGFVVSSAGRQVLLRNHDGNFNTQSAVNAVAHEGWAAGTDVEGGCSQAVAWLYNTGQSWPEFRMGTCGASNGITADWYVVGTGTDVSNNPTTDTAFVWFPGPGLQSLPGLGTAGETSTAVAINSLHHVLGQITEGAVVHTVIWNVAATPH